MQINRCFPPPKNDIDFKPLVLLVQCFSKSLKVKPPFSQSYAETMRFLHSALPQVSLKSSY